jgi:hypothetical protein
VPAVARGDRGLADTTTEQESDHGEVLRHAPHIGKFI